MGDGGRGGRDDYIAFQIAQPARRGELVCAKVEAISFRMAPIVLTIAGSDPTSGAGLQADLQTFTDMGCKGRSVVTAITAQTDDRVLGMWPTPADILTHQLSTSSAAVQIDAVKIGLIATAANVWAIVWFLKARQMSHIVIDPLLHSSSGFPLLDSHAIPIFRQHLLPLATVITPNIPEAMALAGMQIASVEAMEKAAQLIRDEAYRLRGGGEKPLAVVVKGGHLKGEATDVLYDGTNTHRIEGLRETGSIHGSGCRYSSAIAAELAKGSSVVDAARAAKRYVADLIKEKMTIISS